MSLRSRLGLAPEPLYLMDGSAFIFRSFYAFRNMTRADGFPTNALYLVARLVLRLLREEKPTHFAFVMDGKGKNFRHEKFEQYKAQRSATPEPLVQQLAPLRDFLRILGVPVIVSEGCEADDCLASLAHKYREVRPIVILGADKDLKQCLHENVILWDPASKDEKITTLQSFTEEMGMAPSSWPDFQALVGDSSDNIPGVPKIGPKTAIGLIQEFATLENLFDHLPSVSPKVRPKLEGQRENAMLYRELTTLSCDACPLVDEAALAVTPADFEPLLAFMAEYELRSLSREVESMVRAGFLGKGGSLPGSGGPLGGPSPTSAPPRNTTGKGASSSSTSSLAASSLAASGQQTVAGKKQSAAASGSAAPATAPIAGGLWAGSASGPQPLTPAAPKAVRAAGQGSLFDAGAGAGAAPVFTEVADISALPFTGQNALVIIPSESGLIVGVKEDRANGAANGAMPGAMPGGEFLYTGADAELAAALGRDDAPPLVIVPDAKKLQAERPAFSSLAASRWFDLSLAAYLLSPEDRGYAFTQVASRWAEQSGSAYAPQTQAEGAGNHPALLAFDLHAFFSEQLKGAGLEPVYEALEVPLIAVLLGMEERGIAVDKAAFAAFLDEVQNDLDRLTLQIHEQAGRVFNIRSSQQLGDVLFTVLDLPKAGKTRGGAMSTSQESLEKLMGKHPIIESILEYRKLEKLRSTYLEPLPRLADGEGRIHTTFNQTATATGRLSSSNPNLQNIPVRGDMGKRMRACFIAAEGKRIVCADYSQIELRVLAHLSEDPALLDAFRNNEDIHSRTAGLLFDTPIEQVSPDMRRNAKTINFGLVYGMGAQKLAQELHIPMKEAKIFIERYFERLSKLKEFYDSIEEDAKRDGYVATMAGRRRLTPEILSQNNQLRSQARRQAINTRIQGSAADIIKLAMLAVEHDAELEALGARLLLQIHDELLLEAPIENAEAAGKRLAALMEAVRPGGAALSVPLLVEWGTGISWAEAH